MFFMILFVFLLHSASMAVMYTRPYCPHFIADVTGFYR